jgi:hypothetical protein
LGLTLCTSIACLLVIAILKESNTLKAYFYMQEGTISILCCDSHIDDYKDAKLRSIAKERLYEMLEVFKTQ